jgi:hypothetical protein
MSPKFRSTICGLCKGFLTDEEASTHEKSCMGQLLAVGSDDYRTWVDVDERRTKRTATAQTRGGIAATTPSRSSHNAAVAPA